MTAHAGDTLDSLMTQKQSLRRQLREQRRALSLRQRRLAARRCTRKALAHPALRDARHVGIYLHHGAELATDGLISALWKRGVQTYVPTTRPDRQMIWVRLTAKTPLRKHHYGIAAPRFSRPRIALNRLQVLVVPLVGVDPQLNRLGAGGGYYDRLPHRPHHQPRWLGWAYSQQCVDAIPCDPWDRALDLLITDRSPPWPTG